jgi:hypothetical protein
METYWSLFFYCVVMVYALKALLVCFAMFMPVPGVTGCPVYDRYAIHTFDGLQGFDSFSSAWKDMMDGDREIIQYDYVTYIRQLKIQQCTYNLKLLTSFLSPTFNSS